MKINFDSLSLTEKRYYHYQRLVNPYVGIHTIKRNKVFITFEEIRETVRTGNIKFVEKKTYKGKLTTNLIIISPKTEKIEGIDCKLNVVYSLDNKKVVTAFYRGTKFNKYNLGKRKEIR